MGYTERAINQFYGAIQCMVIFQFLLHNKQLIEPGHTGHIVWWSHQLCVCRINSAKRIASDSMHSAQWVT